MLETLKTASILASGIVSVIFLLALIGYVGKNVYKHFKTTKPDRDLKKLKKLQAKCGGKNNG